MIMALLRLAAFTGKAFGGDLDSRALGIPT